MSTSIFVVIEKPFDHDVQIAKSTCQSFHNEQDARDWMTSQFDIAEKQDYRYEIHESLLT